VRHAAKAAFCGVLPLLVTVSCADKPPAAIENRSVAAVEVVPEVRQVTGVGREYGEQLRAGVDYVVQPGDTLYAVAFRLGMDYRALAEMNHIDPPYVIHIAQVLKTVDPNDGTEPDTMNESAPIKSGAESSSDTTVAEASSADPPATIQNNPPDQPRPRPASVAPPAPVSAPNVPMDRWVWPADGRVSRPFSEELHKGIDVSGERGADIRATAPGVVVYAGTGVTGYGALLIVKHNDTYLSAYGHNDALLAGEGQQVSAGQVIAKMGSTSTDAVKLHFEIRRNGVPVNPATLLPRR
jgi:lipoprotein NlpD